MGRHVVLAEHGADVVLAGRRVDPLESTAKEIDKLGRPGTGSSHRCQQRRRVSPAGDTTLARVWSGRHPGELRGGAETQSIFKWSDEDFEKVLTLNFKAAWHLSRAVAKPMIEQGKGAIVNISSGASLLAMPQAAPYGAAKAAMNNLTGSMAAAWAKKGIRVNAIAVGAVRAATSDRRRRTLWP